MRFAYSLILAAALANTSFAQRPRAVTRFLSPPDDASLRQTLTFDVAAAFQERYRAATEALVFGRFSIGLSGEYTTQSDDRQVYYPTPLSACLIDRPCPDYYYPYEDARKYRAWSFNVHGRWYPRKLSFDGDRQSASVYIGEFIGYHERRLTQSAYYGYGCPSCEGMPRGDSVTVSPLYPPYPYPDRVSYTQKLHGWEPGAELGIRVMPARHVVIDVGGMLRIETLMDPQSGVRPGGLVKQLAVAVGVGW